MTLEALRERTDALRAEIGRTVLGQDEVVELLLVALFARGHVLLEGPPGTAKTLLARSFAAALDLDFGRIQFTPDLMPGDVLGTSIFNFQTNNFVLTKGPVFSQVLLADEINRAPPKTQAALLQAMNERMVSIDGTDHTLGRVHRRRHAEPDRAAGHLSAARGAARPLPVQAGDRFPAGGRRNGDPETARRRTAGSRPGDECPLEGAGCGRAGRNPEAGRRHHGLKDDILAYILRLMRATRESSEIAYGASTRAADALASATRATAALSGRDFAIPDDVKRLFIPTLRHRIVLGPAAEIEGRSPAQVLENILNQIEAPR
jgi:MoxR-like ATPase